MLKRLSAAPQVVSVCADLRRHGFPSFLVGGAVRDLLHGLTPVDWDVATPARPEQVMAVFPAGLPTGLSYGTVTVPYGGIKIEVTTFRGEGTYGDGRHPDKVAFGGSIEDDLARRDFTVNAMAYDPLAHCLIDPYGGRRDLRRGFLAAVGDPAVRFAEDALRMLRFYRFLAVLGFRPDPAAEAAVRPEMLARISPERIRDELIKIILAAYPDRGLSGLARSGLMQKIIPELAAGAGCGREGRHQYNVLEHTIHTVTTVRPRLHLRLAALLHDVGKPSCRTESAGEIHYHGHDQVGAVLAAEILARLRFPRRLSAEVVKLVRLHMFQLPVHPSDAALRRLMQKAGGPGGLRDLIELRRADIIATGPFYWRAAGLWRELKDRVEEVIAAGSALGAADLAVNGHDLMRELQIAPGPEVGRILAELLAAVTDDPTLNNQARLLDLARSIHRRRLAKAD